MVHLQRGGACDAGSATLPSLQAVLSLNLWVKADSYRPEGSFHIARSASLIYAPEPAGMLLVETLRGFRKGWDAYLPLGQVSARLRCVWIKAFRSIMSSRVQWVRREVYKVSKRV